MPHGDHLLRGRSDCLHQVLEGSPEIHAHRRADRTTTGRGIIVAASSPALRESHTNSWGGRRRPRSPRGGAHRSPLTAPPRPWHPTHSSLLRGAWRHVQRLPRPTSPSRPPPRPRRWPRRPRRSPCGSFGSRAPSLSRPRCSHGPSPRPSGRRRRLGVTSAPPEHLPGGQRLRSGAGGPCEPAGATSEYSKARASPLSPARRVSLTTPPPPGSGVHRAYKMAAERSLSDAISSA